MKTRRRHRGRPSLYRKKSSPLEEPGDVSPVVERGALLKGDASMSVTGEEGENAEYSAPSFRPTWKEDTRLSDRQRGGKEID